TGLLACPWPPVPVPKTPRLQPPSSTVPFEAEWTYAYSSCPAPSSSRPSTGLLPTRWKQRSQIAGDPQQSHGVAARKTNSPLGLVGPRREGLGHAAWNQPVHRRR